MDAEKLNAHQAYAAGLRAIADMYEAHPDIPLPWSSFDNYAVNTKEDAVAVARALGSCKKQYSDETLTISRLFGPIEARFVFSRSEVCVRKVVGTELVPEQIIPARTKEIVEWECLPILAPSADGTLAEVPDARQPEEVPF